MLFVLVFLMLSRLFIAALWSPAGKGLTSWLLLVMFIVFCYFPLWYPGQVWLCRFLVFAIFSYTPVPGGVSVCMKGPEKIIS